MRLLKIAKIMRAAALSVWLLGIIAAFVVAPIIFKNEPNRAKAGARVGALLHTAALIKVGLMLAALAADAALFFSKRPEAPRGWRRYVPPAALMGAAAIVLFNLLWLEPHMLALRDKIPDFSDKPEALAHPARVEFGKWHGVSMGVLMMEAIFVAFALVAGLA